MIPGFEQREMWMSVFVLAIAVIFSIGHYLYHKNKTNTKPRINSVITYAVFGFMAGMVLLVATAGGEGISHWVMAGNAGIYGAASEYVVADVKTRMGK